MSSTGFDRADFSAALGGEALRLTDGTKVRRPAPRNRRTPGGEWDPFYELSEAEQSWIRRDYMADLGSDPTDLARWAGFGADLPAWWSAWLTAIRAEKRSHARAVASLATDPLSDAYADRWEDAEAERTADLELELYGPQELAPMLGVKVAVVHQRRKRGTLPAADLVISGVPIWHGYTLRGAGIL